MVLLVCVPLYLVGVGGSKVVKASDPVLQPGMAIYLPLIHGADALANDATDETSTLDVLAAARPAPPTLNTLQPGGFRDIQQDLPVNIVFVGFEPGTGTQELNEAAFRSMLTESSRACATLRSITRSRTIWG
jgi:hypothetical protein